MNKEGMGVYLLSALIEFEGHITSLGNLQPFGLLQGLAIGGGGSHTHDHNAGGRNEVGKVDKCDVLRK